MDSKTEGNISEGIFNKDFFTQGVEKDHAIVSLFKPNAWKYGLGETSCIPHISKEENASLCHAEGHGNRVRAAIEEGNYLLQIGCSRTQTRLGSTPRQEVHTWVTISFLHRLGSHLAPFLSQPILKEPEQRKWRKMSAVPGHHIRGVQWGLCGNQSFTWWRRLDDLHESFTRWERFMEYWTLTGWLPLLEGKKILPFIIFKMTDTQFQLYNYLFKTLKQRHCLGCKM